MGKKKVIRMHSKNDEYVDVKVDVDECCLIDLLVEMFKRSESLPRLILPTHPHINYPFVVDGEWTNKDVGTDSQLMEMFEDMKDRSFIEVWLTSSKTPSVSLIAARKIARAGCWSIDLNSLSSSNNVGRDAMTTPLPEPNPISPRRVKKAIPPGYWNNMKLKSKAMGNLAKKKRPLPPDFQPRKSPRKHVEIQPPSDPIPPTPQPTVAAAAVRKSPPPSNDQPEVNVMECEADSTLVTTPVTRHIAPTADVGDKSQPRGSSSQSGRKIPGTTARRMGIVVQRRVEKDALVLSSGREARQRSKVSSNTVNGETADSMDSDSADSSYSPESLDEGSDQEIFDLEH